MSSNFINFCAAFYLANQNQNSTEIFIVLDRQLKMYFDQSSTYVIKKLTGFHRSSSFSVELRVSFAKMEEVVLHDNLQ